MLEEYIEKLKTYIRPEWRLAFFSSILFGLIAHLYKFTNTLLIHDSLYNLCSSLENISSGRWFIVPAGLLSSFFDLPWINGLLSLIYIGLTAAVITDIFQSRSRIVIVLSSALLVTFPCITNAFFFEYTADAYLLSMLLSSLAVRLSMPDKQGFKYSAAAAVCLCLSLGIYQSYLSFSLLLTICIIMNYLLSEGSDISARDHDLKLYISRQLIVYAVGIASYFIIWKLLMILTHTPVSSYQGVDKAGILSIHHLVTASKNCIISVGKLFMGQNLSEHGWTVYAALNGLFLVTAFICILSALKKSGLFKRTARLLLFVLCLIAIPFAACIFYFVSPGVFYHPLMLQSISVFYIFVLILAERYFSLKSAALTALLFSAIIGRNVLNANICYHEMDIAMERSRSMATEILTRVHMLDDGSVKRIAIVNFDNPSRVDECADQLSEAVFSAVQLRTHLLYCNEYAYLYLHEILHCEYSYVCREELNQLLDVPEFQEMAVWPERDSVKKFGNTIVIKLPYSFLSFE